MLSFSPLVTAYLLFVAALFGAATGSFVNCAAYRLAHGGSALKGRSACPYCGHTLAPRDLIPVVSYAALRGRCRYCGERISPRCLYCELLGIAVCVSAALRYGLSLRTASCVFLLFVLMAASLVDLDTGYIPDRLVLIGIGGFLLFSLIGGSPLRSLLDGLIGGLATAVPLLLLVLLFDKLMARESMGGGDIKLIFMANLYFGWKCGILLLIISCLFGLAFALAARKKAGAEFPFGPAIAAAAWAVCLFGNTIVNWYSGFFY